jgi:tetratricopeptide (TPR) repeat protein
MNIPALIVLISGICFASNLNADGKSDSLEKMLTQAEGISRTRILNELSKELMIDNPLRGLHLAEEALELSNVHGGGLNKAISLENIGKAYFTLNDFSSAADYLSQSKQIYEDLGLEYESARTSQNTAIAYMQATKFNEAENYMLKAVEFYLNENKYHDLAFSYLNLGLIYYYKSDYASALDYYERASEIYLQIDDPTNYSRLLNRIGMTYWSLGINDKALASVMESTEMKEENDLKGRATGYNNIGAIYRDLDEPEKALEYYYKALLLYRQAGDTIDTPAPLTNIGSIYNAQGSFNTALAYYSEAIRLSELYGDRLQTAKTKYNIAMVFQKEGNLSQAEDYLREYLDLSREIGSREGEAYALKALGDLDAKRNKINSALEHYYQCLSLADSLKHLQLLNLVYLDLSNAMERKGHPLKALDYYRLYSQVKDSLLNAEKARIITEIETSFGLEKKRRENELLIKDNELKDQQIKILYMVVGGFLLLIVVVILLIIQYRKITIGRKLLAESEAARLRDKVEHQERELASSALALSRNLTLINKLLDDLKLLSSKANDEEIPIISRITRSLSNLDSNNCWKEFELRFQNVHTHFYENLLCHFPSLTNNEMRLCAFLKLGMSTKEISSVTFQNVRAIEAARLRLRKKFSLEGNEDLSIFLQKY